MADVLIPLFSGHSADASQAREQQLREAMGCIQDLAMSSNLSVPNVAEIQNTATEALALPQDTTALSAMIAKAGEVMRERCILFIRRWISPIEIRTIPAVTIDDLK